MRSALMEVPRLSDIGGLPADIVPARAHPDADFEFEIFGRAKPGTQLDRMEEFYIREGGGPTNLSNPNGGLANMRHQMSDPRYLAAGGGLLNRPGVSGGSNPWEGWSHVREHVEEVSG